MRKLFSYSVPLVLALFVALSGCGGGGKGGTNGGTTSTGTLPTVVDAPGIVRDINSLPVVGAKVTFYNSSGTALSTVTINSTGQAGTPPAGATAFSVNVTSVKSSGVQTYYDTYLYNSLNYSGTLTNPDGSTLSCNSPLVNGAFASSVVFIPTSTQQPPSAPDGCS